MKFFLFLCLLLPVEIKANATTNFPSPNQQYVVQVTNEDTHSLLVIKNQQSSKIELSTTDFLPPILHIQWAPNSESFVVIQHLAKASLANLVHHNNNNTWAEYTNEPRFGFPCNYSVLGVKFLKNVVQLSYGVSPVPNNGEMLTFKRYVLNMNYNDGTTKIVSIKPITLDEFLKQKNEESKKWFLKEAHSRVKCNRE